MAKKNTDLINPCDGISSRNREDDMFGIITLKDEFTMNNLPEWISNLKDSLSKWDVVVVDTAEVKKVDIAAIQMLIAAQKECLKNGHEFILRKSDAVTNLLRSVGIRL